MLVLTRKTGESIVIGDNIIIKIISTEGEQVKIGIDAPKDVKIHRQEVYYAIQQENQLASVRKTAVNIEELKNIGTTHAGMQIKKET